MNDSDTCGRGHALQGHNLFLRQGGRRGCRKCMTENDQAYRKRMQEAYRLVKAVKAAS